MSRPNSEEIFHLWISQCLPGSLLESVRAKTQLLWSRCYQVGPLHWTQWTLRNTMLNVNSISLCLFRNKQKTLVMFACVSVNLIWIFSFDCRSKHKKKKQEIILIALNWTKILQMLWNHSSIFKFWEHEKFIQKYVFDDEQIYWK